MNQNAMSTQNETAKSLILILEDEYRVAVAIARMLRRATYRTIIARSVEEAKKLYMVHCHELDIVLADYGMRGEETGLDYLSWVKSQDCNIRRILISGFELHHFHHKMDSCCHAVLQKPFDMKQLELYLNASVSSPSYLNIAPTDMSSS